MLEQSPPLPIMPTVKKAALNGLLHIDVLVKTLAIWLLLHVVLTSIFMFLGGDAYFDGLTAQNILRSENGLNGDFGSLEYFENSLKQVQLQRELGGVFTVYSFANILIIIGAAYSLAVAWHRFILLAEPPAWFRVGILEFKYMLFTLFLTLIWYAALYGAEILPIFGGGLAILLVIIALPILGARVLIVLPAIAVADKRFNYDSIWRITKDNVWRIAFGLALSGLVALPIVALAGALNLIYFPENIKLPFQLFLHLLAASFIISYLSVCYQFFAKILDESSKNDEASQPKEPET